MQIYVRSDFRVLTKVLLQLLGLKMQLLFGKWARVRYLLCIAGQNTIYEC